MASDVLVSDTVGAGQTNEFDIMTSSNGTDAVQEVVDLMASPSTDTGASGSSTDGDAVKEPEIVAEEVAPAQLLKMAMAAESNGNANGNGTANGDSESPEPQTNGHANGNGNGNGHHHHENGNGHAQENGHEELADEEQQQQNGHHHVETVVVKQEEAMTDEGDVVSTTTTTVVKVDESQDGETQVVTTTVKTTTVSHHSSELIVEVGQNDGHTVEAHELAAITEAGEEKEPAEEQPKEEDAAPQSAPTTKDKEKQSAARRLFNFVRSPVKQKTIDDPTQAAASEQKEKEKQEAGDVAAAEAKTKSPPHQRRLFGWRKTWTPEKGKGEQAPAAAADGEAATEKTAEETAASEPAAAAAAPEAKKVKKAKKGKKQADETAESHDTTQDSEAAGDKSAVEDKVVSPKKKIRLGFGMIKSKSTTNSPAKPPAPAEKSAAEKWQGEECAEPAKPTEGEKAVDVVVADVTATESKPVADESQVADENKEVNLSATEKWVAESCTERPATPLKEEAKAVEASVVEKTTTAEEPPKKKEKKQSSVRKSWTFRMNRSQTESEKMAAKSATLDHREAPPALHPDPHGKPAQSPGKPFFSGLLHRKKKEVPSTPSKTEEDKPATETTTEDKICPAESKVAESMSMPHLTPEKHNQSASEKWAAEECEAVQSKDVHVDFTEPASTSTAVKKEGGVEGSPMRRSASLRMPSSLSRFFRFLGPRQRTTTVSGGLGEEATPDRSGAVTPPASTSLPAPHTTSLTTPVSPRSRKAQTMGDTPATDSKSAGVTMTPGRQPGGFRFWSNWRASGGAGTFGRFRRKDKADGQTSHDDTSLIVNTSLGGPVGKSATLHDMPKGGEGAPTVDLGAILARLPPHSPKDHSPSYIGISRVLNGYAEYNSPTKRSGASSQASHKSPGGTVMATLDLPEVGIEGGSLLQTVTAVCTSTGEINRDAHACLATADAEQARLEARCASVKSYLDAPELTAEARGQIEATLGKTNLLLTQKFKQFRDLCHEATKPAVEGQTAPPNSTDLAGFWDLVLIQVADLNGGFNAIEAMKTNNWQKPDTTAAATNGASTNGSKSADSKKQKKAVKKDEAKTKKVETESKSRFAEFKQRMFKGKEKSVDKETTNGESNGVANGEAVAAVPAAAEEVPVA